MKHLDRNKVHRSHVSHREIRARGWTKPIPWWLKRIIRQMPRDRI
jgi:hypothetical protein